MFSKNQKRISLFTIALIVSSFIYYVNNILFHNTIIISFILSATTFLIIITPFEIYFSFRDLWFERWDEINTEGLKIEKIKIPVNDGFLIGNLINKSPNERSQRLNSIIIINPGFSDVKEDLQFFSYSLALQGYTVLIYDSRGTGESKMLGDRSDFLAKLNDFNNIIDWLKTDPILSDYNIYTVGFSIGAIVALCQGFPDERIKKIIAISAISNYRENIPKYNPIVLLTYSIKGVKMFLNDEENAKLSPYQVIKETKKKISSTNWKKYSKRVFLIHTMNDKLIKFKNFKENSEILELKDENKMVLKKGGHTLKKDELILVMSSLRFFNDQLKEKY